VGSPTTALTGFLDAMIQFHFMRSSFWPTVELLLTVTLLFAAGARQVATGMAHAKKSGAKVFVTSMCIGSGMVRSSIPFHLRRSYREFVSDDNVG
jgi:hypothetical protein